MTSGFWRFGPAISVLCCGVVLLGAPSEIDHMALAGTWGRTIAMCCLAVIGLGSLVAAIDSTARCSVVALRWAGVACALYGVTIIVDRGAAALPGAGFALYVALSYLDRAQAILDARTKD